MLSFIQTNDNEISQIKNKVARDLATSERQTQETLKSLKATVDQQLQTLE